MIYHLLLFIIRSSLKESLERHTVVILLLTMSWLQMAHVQTPEIVTSNATFADTRTVHILISLIGCWEMEKRHLFTRDRKLITLLEMEQVLIHPNS